MSDDFTEEKQEWMEAWSDILSRAEADSQARDILQGLLGQMGTLTSTLTPWCTDYINTIALDEESHFPKDEEDTFWRLLAILRWNALMMVLRAGKAAPELGGHIATYASIIVLYEIGLNYFFHQRHHKHGGDLVYFQGHSSPGLYARLFLEGRLDEQQLSHFRQEIHQPGLSSYPHPWLMPDIWSFATVSMGLGPIQAIYQARFLRYMHQRGLSDTADRHVWCFCGDGEMDEPESLGAITVASREKLDNLIFVINCNLQRLDGPVRGNGKIIQELEGMFLGAGWHVIKVIWGRGWDKLFAHPDAHVLIARMNEVLDGEYQNYRAKDGAYIREHFFGANPILQSMVADWSDEDIWDLTRGGLDAQKVFAAYHAAVQHQGQPVVVLAKTVKGFGMGSSAGEGQNITHQQKKMTLEQIKAYRDRFNIPVDDAHVESFSFYRPADDSPEIQYLQSKREALGGPFPARSTEADTLTVPSLQAFKPLLEGSGDREISTTMAFVRFLSIALKDKSIGPRLVPIVPDEARTFGMEGLFRQIGIYAPFGQQYVPVDKEQVMYYKEARDGQLLQEGLNEAGAFCSWISAATAYSHSQCTLIPFYIYYSMFGFQRIGDLAWAAGDMQARGFLLGATAGRTTLAGEGLQHQDGHSHVLAATIPNCVSYDPAYGYELAVLLHHGLERMVTQKENVYFYLTVMNENYIQPPMPKGVESGIISGMYLFEESDKASAQLLASGTLLPVAREAALSLKKDFDVAVNVWSVTSFSELAREGQAKERAARLAGEWPFNTYVGDCLAPHEGPVIAVSDYMRVHMEPIRPFVPGDYTTLGTDGFGRSDTRAALRYFFEVDANMIAYTTLYRLYVANKISKKVLDKARMHYQIDVNKPNPTTV